MNRFCLPTMALVSISAVNVDAGEMPTPGSTEASEAVASEAVASEAVGAQPDETPAEEARSPVEISATTPAQDAAELDEAWSLYEEAFRAALRNDLVTAEQRLRRIIDRYPMHPAARSARSVLETVGAAQSAPSKPKPVSELGVEEPTNLARAEIAVYQTMHGIGVGIEACLLLGCDSAQIWAVALTAFAGGGLAASLLLTTEGVRPGTAMAVDSGTTWGFWNALALLSITTPGGDNAEKKWAGTLLGAQLAGLGSGVLASMYFEPTAGDISLANSAGIWSGVIALWFYGLAASELTGDSFWGTLLIASDAGLIAGSFASRVFPMSRGRTLVIDAGGILGILVGGAAIVLVGVDNIDRRGGFGIMTASTIGGLALTTFLTRDWDAPDVPVHASVVPIGDPVNGITGAQGVIGFSF